jgi:septal ring factor EnvC (AmiA/AmiB activator)
MSVLIEERKKKQADSEKALERERQNALALSRQVDGLTDLIGRLEQGISAAAKARAQRGAPRGRAETRERPDLAALKDPGRLEPLLHLSHSRAISRCRRMGSKFVNLAPPTALVARKRAFRSPPGQVLRLRPPAMDGWFMRVRSDLMGNS